MGNKPIYNVNAFVCNKRSDFQFICIWRYATETTNGSKFDRNECYRVKPEFNPMGRIRFQDP